ncbi:hypothetical protein [Ilumatobacter nonamiensis]|uniref:hypothetical protein n=1 Tax=Ilumatobacter nonamiensis TaxID=467093 RepID=UPI00034DF113|nr:hypothetical protein [Ilumatobacter nonamiensis]
MTDETPLPSSAGADPTPTPPTGELSPPTAGTMVRPADDTLPIPAPAEGEDDRSAAAAMTTELVSGLRTVSRHLARPSASEGHLRTELTIAARHIDSVIQSEDAADEPWAIAAMSLVHDSAAALAQRRVADGWQLLRAARLEIIEGMDERGLAVEMSKLTGSELVLDDDVDVDELRSRVWVVRQKRNTYDAELERRMFESARGIAYRAWVLVGVLVFGAIGVLIAGPSTDSDNALGSLSAYLTTVGLAVTGAAVSHVLFTRNSTRAETLSDVVNPLHLVMLRLAFGGVIGLILVVLLQADIQNLVNVSALAAYPWAILGGFAERYVDRVIDRTETDAYAAADSATRSGTS